ncbi:L-carnitine dehydratase/bile acid-inducible protein F [Syntrophobacter fumaroxidans MPOB]|uniref:L-carnitine dehydratase/bile acid-inducible protein F n=2 Tax=Syntrophobacter TaxID=29526 RepID=A0LHX9_SYNFM|nr:L-carnitine dehydratase/bile acid-inducible protein F [Syntrophobacter fumaroxidans MPOB]
MTEKKTSGMTENADYSEWAFRETNPADVFEKPEALDDLLVLDAGRGSFAGLYASSLLAELGAEVIRVEPPEGDPARRMSPYGMMIQGTGLGYIVEGRNKFHITLDLDRDEGRRLFAGLARKADVVIETFKPGHMDSIGLGYRQLSAVNPGIVCCSIHTCGQFGQEAERNRNQPDYDIVDQARGLVMSVTGESELDADVPETFKRPLKQGNWMGWYAGGAWAVFGILLALFHRRRAGVGQLVDCSPPEGLGAMANYAIPFYHLTGRLMPRAGNYDYAVFPYTYVKCKDGYAFISGSADPNWTALCEIIERPDLISRFPSIRERLDPPNQPVIRREIEAFTTRHTTDELLEMVTAYRNRPDRKGVVVTGRLETPRDVLRGEHWAARNTFVKTDDPHYGEVLVQNSTFKSMSRTPGRIKWVCRPVGADNAFIYERHLGLSEKELEELRTGGVI